MPLSFLSQPDDELLSAFLDGELRPEHEEEFFTRLAGNHDLRARLRDLQTIQASARSYASSAVPPAAVTQSVFTTLGIGGEYAGRAIGGSSMFTRIIQKAWIPAVAAVLSSVATLFVYTNIQSGFDRSQSPRIVHESAPVAPALSKDNAGSNVGADAETRQRIVTRDRTRGVVDQRISTQRVVSEAEPAVPVIREVGGGKAVETDQSRQSGRGTELSDITVATGDRKSENSVRNPDAPVPGQEAPSGTLKELESPIASTLTPKMERFILQNRGMSTVSEPRNSVPTRSDPWFNNMTVALMYKLNESQSVGFEIGQEAFPQNFEGTEEGRHVWYEQNLLTVWVDAAYRNSFSQLRFFNSLIPFMQIGLGATREKWLHANATVGLELHPSQNVSLFAGYDGSLLLYKFQQTWFTTQKTGFTYGFGIQF